MPVSWSASRLSSKDSTCPLRHHLDPVPRLLDGVQVRLHLSDALELNVAGAAQLVDGVSELVQDDGAFVQRVDDVVVFTARHIRAGERCETPCFWNASERTSCAGIGRAAALGVHRLSLRKDQLYHWRTFDDVVEFNGVTGHGAVVTVNV